MKKVMLLASEEICGILRSALDHKYITLPCSDSAAGGVLLGLKPEALILELSLPGNGGMTFLKENGAHLPPVVLVLTVFVSNGLLRELAALGVSSVILLPCRVEGLKEQLSHFLEEKNPSR